MTKRYFIKIIALILVINILIVNCSSVIAFEQNIQESSNTSINDEKINVQLEQKIEKYVSINENTTLLQQSLKVNIDKKTATKESEKLEIEIPEIQNSKAKNIQVLLNGTKLADEMYTYEENTNVLIISTLEGTINDNYKIISQYQDIKIEEATNVTLNAKVYTTIKDYGEIESNNSKEIELKQTGEVISNYSQITSKLYKGYLYEGKENETPYKENYIAEISNTENIEEIQIETNKEKYTKYTQTEDEEIKEEMEINNSIYYKSTIINSKKAFEILGKEGQIQIRNQNDELLATITNTTEVDENGNIVVNYENDNTTKIKILTTKPVTIGTLEILGEKGIKANTGYNKEQLGKIQYLEENIDINNSSSLLKIELLDTQAKTKLEVNKQSFSTMTENQDVEIKVTLQSNSNSMELLKNPTIKINMPEEVEQIQIQDQIKLLYEDEMQIADVAIDARTITIKLKGEQTTYKTESIEGSVLIFKANITLNKLAINATRDIELQVVNENSKTAEDKKEIKVISPREIITVNNIEDLGITTLGEEEKQQIEIKKNAKSKDIVVKSQIINNKGEDLTNVNIMGIIASDGTLELNGEKVENNLGITLTSPLQTTNMNAKIYYTTNINATNNLSREENGWSQDTNNLQKATKYLIVIDLLEKDANFSFEEYLKIPQGLENNKQACEGYEVSYANKTKEIANSVKSTYVMLTTGSSANIESSITATCGTDELTNNSSLKTGEVIKYKINVKNTGTKKATNVLVTGKIPEGTVLVEPVEKFEYTGNIYYQEIDAQNKQETISELEVGETKTVVYEVRVKNDVLEGTIITNNAQIEYEDIVKQTNEIANTIEVGNIRASVKRVSDRSIDLYPGQGIKYFAIIENTSDTDLNNVKVDISIPEGTTLSSLIRYVTNKETNESESIELEKTTNLNIETLEAGEITKIGIFVKVDIDIKELEKDVFTSVKLTDENKKQYRSNAYEDVINGYDLKLELTTKTDKSYVKTGDQIEYNIKVTNNSKIPTTILTLEDEIPDYLSIQKITENGKELNSTEYNKKLSKVFSLEAKDTYELDIVVIVNYSDSRVEDIEITNTAVLSLQGSIYQQKSITHMMQKEENSPNIEDPDNGDGTTYTYTISGKAWIDANNDGEMQETEEHLGNIKAMILDANTSKLMTDDNGNVLEVKTNSSGTYKFSSLPKGKYVVIFEYDTSRYTLATYQKTGVAESNNSNVFTRKINMGNVSKTYAVTDYIEITNRGVANINIGLVKAEEFDLKLDKYITRITVQENGSTKVYSYTDAILAKVELDAKKMKNTKITVEYKVKVTNVGQIAGYVRKIIDYMPEGFTLDGTSGTNWHTEGGNITNVSLANEQIQVGASKEVTVIMSKTINSENTGTYTNMAEIGESYNEQGISDINSTPANKTRGENDIGIADMIISIKTGKEIVYIVLSIVITLIIGTGIYLIKKKVIDVKD